MQSHVIFNTNCFPLFELTFFTFCAKKNILDCKFLFYPCSCRKRNNFKAELVMLLFLSCVITKLYLPSQNIHFSANNCVTEQISAWLLCFCSACWKRHTSNRWEYANLLLAYSNLLLARCSMLWADGFPGEFNYLITAPVTERNPTDPQAFNFFFRKTKIHHEYCTYLLVHIQSNVS